MKITKSQLKQIIKEELETVIQEKLDYNDLKEILGKAWDIAGMGASKYFEFQDFLVVASELQHIKGYPENTEELAMGMFTPVKSSIKKRDIDTEVGLLEKLKQVLQNPDQLFDSVFRKMGRAVGLIVGKEKKFRKDLMYLKSVVQDAISIVKKGGAAALKNYKAMQASRLRNEKAYETWVWGEIGNYYGLNTNDKEKVKKTLKKKAPKTKLAAGGKENPAYDKQVWRLAQDIWEQSGGAVPEEVYQYLGMVPGGDQEQMKRHMTHAISNILEQFGEW